MEAAVESPLTFVHWDYPEKRILLLFYRCRLVSGEPRPLECAAVGWFLPAEIPAWTWPRPMPPPGTELRERL